MAKLDEAAIRQEMRDLLNHFDDQKLDNIYYLKFRWADEKDYEDFDDYRNVFKKHLEKSIYKFVSLDKRFKLTVKNTETGHIFTVSFKEDGHYANFKSQHQEAA